MNRSRRSSLLRLGGLVLALGAALTSLSFAAQQTLTTGSGVGTDFAGQRNVIYIPGMGYWAFFHAVNPTNSVESYSADGNTWSTPQNVFPYATLAPNVAAGQPSIWYFYDSVTLSTYVYAVANDGNIESPGIGTVGGTLKTNDTSGNNMFVRRGQLCTGSGCPVGNINWDVGSAVGILTKQMAALMPGSGAAYNANTNCQAGLYPNRTCAQTGTNCAKYDLQAQHSAVVTYSPAVTGKNGAYVSFFGDAGGYSGTQGPYIGVLGIPGYKTDLSDYAGTNFSGTNGVYLYCSGGNSNAVTPLNYDPSMSMVYAPVAVPVLANAVAGSSATVLLGMRPENNNSGINGVLGSSYVLMVSSNSSKESAANSNELTGSFPTLGDDLYGMSALNEYSSSTAHFAWVDSSGSIRYAIRTATQTFVPTNLSNAAVITANTYANTIGTQGPFAHPALSLVTRPVGTPGEDVYVVYVGSDGVSYAMFTSTQAWKPSGAVSTTYKWRGCSSGQGFSLYDGSTPCSADNP
jgi:hypothetical protein